MPKSANLGGVETQEVGRFFTEQQQLYDTALRENYLHHRELFEALRPALESHFQRPFSVLDLGCGDARFSAWALQGLPVSSYTGLDLVADSLEKARENLACLNCPVDLRQADLTEIPDADFDLVMSSYSLHHLPKEDKERLFRSLRVKPGGLITMIDAVLQPGETRRQYLDRFMAWTRRAWVQLEPIHFQLLEEHVENCDFPESTEEWKRISGKTVEVLWADDVPVAQTMVFR